MNPGDSSNSDPSLFKYCSRHWQRGKSTDFTCGALATYLNRPSRYSKANLISDSGGSIGDEFARLKDSFWKTIVSTSAWNAGFSPMVTWEACPVRGESLWPGM